MFEKNYYSLVSGLREYALDSDAKGFDAAQIVGEILEELSRRDAEAVRLLYGYYDCENVAAARSGRTAYNALGNLTQEQVAEALKTGAGLPDAVARVIRAFADPEGEDAEQVDLARGFENALFAAYYDVCEHSSCRFLREWSEFDRTLRNITAALAARAAQRPVDSVTVGGGDVVEQLQRSSAADFGLRGELPYIDAVITAVNDEPYADPVKAIQKVEEIGAAYAIGRDMHVGDTIIGIKGRVGFEAAAPMLIIGAHRFLEKYTLSKWQQYWKDQVANWYGMFLHESQYLEPVMRDIEAMLTSSQRNVSGTAILELRPLSFSTVGVESKDDLVKNKLGEYGEMQKGWTAEDAKGFIKVLSTPLRAYYANHKDEMA